MIRNSMGTVRRSPRMLPRIREGAAIFLIWWSQGYSKPYPRTASAALSQLSYGPYSFTLSDFPRALARRSAAERA